MYMPIKPENKTRYPDNWDAISKDIRFNRAQNRCEVCGVKNGLIIKRLQGNRYRTPSMVEWDMIHSRIRHANSNMTESIKHHGFTKVVLTVAHLDHQPENCDYSNLKAMCQKCHNNYDKEHRKQTRNTDKYRGMESLF